MIAMEKLKITLIVLFSVMLSVSFGQIDVRGKIKNESANRAERSIDKEIDKTFDKIEKGIGGLFKKKVKSINDDDVYEIKTEEETVASDIEPASQNSQKLASYTQYDFVTGDKVLYFDDFSEDAIGDFPANWTSNGSGEIATVNIAPGNWLHITSNSAYFCYTKAIELPENFIMEFDFIPDDNF